MPDDLTRRVLVLVDKHSTGRDSLVRAVRARIAALLRPAPTRDFYTARGQRDLAEQMAALDRIASVSVANQTVAYLDAVARQVGQPTPKRVEPLPDRPRGVDPVEAWMRPFEQFRYEYAKSKDEEAARASMLRRVDLMVGDDAGLAMRIAARDHGDAAPTVIGQRRVVHPEVSKGGTCGLCLVASDQLYRKGELLPLHNGCLCTVAEVFEDADPGDSLNGLSLKQIYAAAGGSTARAELQRVRYRISEHDELGPQLVAA